MPRVPPKRRGTPAAVQPGGCTASAAQAADYAKQMAETYAEIVAIKAEMVEYLAQAQKAAEDAEAAERQQKRPRRRWKRLLKKAQEAALTAAKYSAIIELVGIDVSDYTPEQMERWMPPWPRPDRPWKLPRRWKKSRLLWLRPKEAIQAAGELVCASDLFGMCPWTHGITRVWTSWSGATTWKAWATVSLA